MASPEELFRTWLNSVEPAIARFTFGPLIQSHLKDIQQAPGLPYEVPQRIASCINDEAVELAIICGRRYPIGFNDLLTKWYPYSTSLIGIATRDVRDDFGRLYYHHLLSLEAPTNKLLEQPFESRLTPDGLLLMKDKTGQSLISRITDDPGEIAYRQHADEFGIADRLVELGAIRYRRYTQQLPQGAGPGFAR